MLRLWPEHIRIGLGAGYAALACLNREKIVYWQMQTWVPETDVPWQKALTTTGEWLTQLNLRNRRIGIALSSELAPLHLMPWREDVMHESQQALLAAAHFRQVHGDAAQHWKISAHPTAYDYPWLASAIDEHLLQAFSERWSGSTVVSVQPLALSLFNKVRRKLAPASWLLIPEPSRTTAMHFRQGRWTLLKSLPETDEPMTERLQRETALTGLDELKSQIYSPMTMPQVSVVDVGWRLGPGVSPASFLHLLGGRA